MAIIAVNVNKERLKLVIISKPFTLSCFKIIEITPTSVVNIYANNPEHVKVAGALKPFLAGRSCVDYETSEP